MERPLALLDRCKELLPQIIHVRVVRQLEVIDTRHDAGEIVVRDVWRLARLADHREHGVQLAEACLESLAIMLFLSHWKGRQRGTYHQ